MNKVFKKIHRKIYLLIRQIRWATTNLMAPECGMMKAFADLVSARLMHQRLKVCAKDDGVEWSMMHTYYANMGGFIVRFEEEEDRQLVSVEVGSSEDDVDCSQQSTPIISDDCVTEHVVSDTMTEQNISANNDCATESVTSNLTTEQNISTSDGDPTNTTEIPTPSVTAVQNMRSFMWSLLRSSQLGPDRYIKRVYKFQNFAGFDWKLDVQNRESVLRALAEYGSPGTSIGLLRWYDNICALQGNVWYVDGVQLLFIRQCGIITSLPLLPKETLEDQSKSDSLTKAFALIQVIWLVLQLIARQTEGLPSAQLEIAVLGFAACSFFTYIASWNKPKGVEASQYITANRRPTVQEIKALGSIGPANIGPHRRYPWISGNSLHTCFQWNQTMPSSSLSPNNFEIEWKLRLYLYCGLILGAVIFSGIHCLSWNSHFPTPVERILWRTSSIFLTSLPLVAGMGYILIYKIVFRLRRVGKTRLQLYIANFSLYALILPYALARLYLTVEMIRSLAYQPPEVWVATSWPNWLPHWG